MNVLPFPRLLLTDMVPLCAEMISFEMVKPNPVLEDDLDSAGAEDL